MAGYDIGPKIGIKGEPEFRKQLNSINNALREYGSEMKALTSEFEENENSQQALIAKSKVMEKQLSAQEQKMEVLQSQYKKQTTVLKELQEAYQKTAKENGESSKEALQAEKAFNQQADSVVKLKISMNETQNYINKLNNAIDKNGTMLNEIESGARDAATGMSTLKDASKETGDALENIEGGIKTGNLMDAADAMSEVGAKIVDAGQKSVEAFTSIEGATTRVNSYFGLTGDAAEQMGGVVENVFRTGVTDSLDEVAQGVITVNNNLRDLDPGTLEKITSQAISMEQVFGSDMDESMRGVNALMTNFGMDAQTAMDYLVTGTQNGLDKTQELGDNLSEYSGKFSQAGYSAEEYFQLLQNGLEGGAYNLDRVNDSINEVTTRLSDGTIAESIGTFSTETQKTFEAWKQGGATQKDVINSIVSDIGNAKTQQEALTLASTAFGTLGEDANLGVIESLTTLGNDYNNVAGAAKEMADSSTTPMQKLQAAMNELQIAIAPIGEKLASFATEVIPPIADGIGKLVEGFLSLPGPVQTFIGVFAGVIALFTILAPAITAVMGIIGAFGTVALAPIAGVVLGIVAAITVAITIFKNWGTITEWLGGVWEIIKEKATDIFGAIRDFLASVWEAIKTGVQTAWNTIKTVISAVMNVIKSIITTIWNAIKTVISTVISVILTIIKTYINLWKTVITTVLNVIKTVVTTVWNAIKTAISTAVKAIKTVVTTVWNAIKTVVVTVTKVIKNGAVNGFKSLVSGIKSILSKVSGIVKNGFNGAINFIKSLPKKALGWGKDFIGGMVKGIESMIGKVTGAVKGVADKIKSFLHFSRPDEGPLREYEKWMPDMMKGLAGGIYGNIDRVKDAARKTATTIETAISGNVSGMIETASLAKKTEIVIEGDVLTIDGREIGRTATKYITSTQGAAKMARGRKSV